MTKSARGGRGGGLRTVLPMIAAAFIAIYWIGGFILNRIDRYIFCITEIHQAIPSPSGRLSAFVYEIDCGATTGFNRQVGFAASEWWFWFWQRPSFFSIHGQHDLSVRWTSEQSLEIVVPKNEAVYRQESAVDGIAIDYR